MGSKGTLSTRSRGSASVASLAGRVMGSCCLHIPLCDQGGEGGGGGWREASGHWPNEAR